MQHLLDHARSFPKRVAQQRDRFDELDTGAVLAHRAHADEFLPL
jgi:hypothetical protein